MIMIIMITRITNSSELTHCAGSGLQHLCCSVCSMPGIYVLQALEAERASASMAWRWAECQKAAAPRRRNREEMKAATEALRWKESTTLENNTEVTEPPSGKNPHGTEAERIHNNAKQNGR